MIYKGNVLDGMTGFDLKKLEELVETALLCDKAANDESVVINVINQAKESIDGGFYDKALQLLKDSWSFE